MHVPPVQDRLQALVQHRKIDEVKRIQLEGIADVEEAVVFQLLEEFPIPFCTPCLHVYPETLDALIVNRRPLDERSPPGSCMVNTVNSMNLIELASAILH